MRNLSRRWLAHTLWASALAYHGTTGADTARPADQSTQLAAAQLVKPFFGELDCENLGYIHATEVDDHIGPIFRSFDLDGSRSIDAQEWRSYPFMRDKALMDISFHMADGDRSGKLTIREFTEYLRSAVASLDSDGDDEVHPAELDRFIAGR